MSFARDRSRVSRVCHVQLCGTHGLHTDYENCRLQNDVPHLLAECTASCHNQGTVWSAGVIRFVGDGTIPR
jgi:hypothetical protein